MLESISNPAQHKNSLSEAFKSFIYGKQPYILSEHTQDRLYPSIIKSIEDGTLLQDEHYIQVFESAIHYVLSGFETDESWQQLMLTDKINAIKSFVCQHGACKELDYFSEAPVTLATLFFIGCDYAHLITSDSIMSINADGDINGDDEAAERCRYIRAAWIHDAIVSLLRCTRRNHIENVIEYLHKQYFFDSMNDSRGNNSAHSHHYWYGGLAKHSYGVYHKSLTIAKQQDAKVTVNSLIIAGLLHDICKAHHKLSGNNIVKRHIHYDGHGKRSIFLLGDKSCRLYLLEDERIAIQNHMHEPSKNADKAKEILWKIIWEADVLDAKMNPSIPSSIKTSLKSLNMGTYFSLPVAIEPKAIWYHKIEGILRSVHVNPSRHFHITAAFINDTAGFNPATMCFSNHNHLSLTLDKLEVFPTTKGDEYVVSITSSNMKPELKAFINNIREELKRQGCNISQPFRLHITLGKVPMNRIALDDLVQDVNSVYLPTFQLSLEKLLYIKKSDHSILKSWNI
jgi:2'-5' RNA ligase/HD superfamily phosphohydrolase YqeK